MNHKFFLPLLLLGMIAAEARAQNLIIRYTDGSEITESLDAIRTLTFSPGTLLVNFDSGSTDTYALSDLQKLYFNTITGIGEDENRSARNIQVYPNPSAAMITVTGIPEDAGSVTVYGIDGAPVLSEEVRDGKAILDITGLRPGLYVVHASGRTAKFIRQ